VRPPAAKPASPATRALQVVPPSGPTVWLTSFTAGAMTFLCVFALALSLASGRLADRWSEALARTATIRLSAPVEQVQLQTDAILALLATTPGIASFRAIDDTETRGLLEPWFGPGLPIEALLIPRLFELVEADPGYDAEGLRQRLAAEAPGALLDDHTRWRRPLAEAAGRIRLLGVLSIALIGAAMAAMITLAARAALATNAEVIRVLRLVGAKDSYIARAFVRRFTLRTLVGATLGAAAGIAGVAALPAADAAGGFLTGLGFSGTGWLWPLVLPPIAALVAFLATRRAAFAKLKELT
jgi:cell division transport system permease protein